MRILAHRGASGYAPENTYAAFELATRMAADALETDVRITRDGVLVLIHDQRVDRTTTGTGFIHELAWQDVQALDAGVKFHPRFAGERIPQAGEFLERFANRIPICLEVKSTSVVDPLVALLQSRGPAANAKLEFTSFEWEIVLRLDEQLPGASVGYLTRSFTNELIEQVKSHGLRRICPQAKDVSPELVDHAHRLGLTVRTWGAKSREVLQHILECGVDGTTLNHPDWICRKNGAVSVVPEGVIARESNPGAEL